MKRCSKCGVAKPLSEYYRMKGMRDGHRNECKQCNLAAQARRRHANPEENRRRVREWQAAHPDRVAARRAIHRSTGQKREWDRRSHLKRRFGITLEDYEEMLAAQGGGCALCHRPPRSDISLHVDHDHANNRIRGLLCFTCNNALGDFEDDTGRLREAARYLESFLAPCPMVQRRLDQLRAMRPAWERA